MITDLTGLNAQARLQQSRLIADFLKQRRAMDGPFENLDTLQADNLKEAMTAADVAVKTAKPRERIKAHLKAGHAAALFRDTRYAVAGRIAMLGMAAHDAMLRAYRGGIESEKVGGV